MLTCFSKQYLGIECPGCGIQRSIVSLFRGDVLDSLALYPGLFPLAIFMLAAILSMSNIYPVKNKWLVTLAIVSGVIIVGHYVLKMLHLAPWYDHAAACFH